MRFLCGILSTVWAISALGCSALIANAGIDLEQIDTRELIVQEFGQPLSVHYTEDGTIESFHTRRKIAEPLKAAGYCMEFGMLLGVYEPKSTAVEVGLFTWNSVIGRDFRILFDQSGNAVRYELYFDDDDLPVSQLETQNVTDE
ncbi:hypothetical protein [Thalassoglobus polymorphus]|uniref:Lipoprotein SmpA/OmlA domain-containing protein n=1 Tax=Thalassoglobus polymorphus TaxID=2527994 RepID=A0A517QMG7_9PLAN|nr:hypothetical protein [Thalassoglobus polymorphus]QDT32832.1 hypothetical protein Mal48_20790 [Thalassoglobus polymorphus]